MHTDPAISQTAMMTYRKRMASLAIPAMKFSIASAPHSVPPAL
jgi:hypothetical protein